MAHIYKNKIKEICKYNTILNQTELLKTKHFRQHYNVVFLNVLQYEILYYDT